MQRTDVDACAEDAVDEAYARIMGTLLPDFRATRSIDWRAASQEDYDRVAAQLRRAIKTTALNAFRDSLRRRPGVLEERSRGSGTGHGFGEAVASPAPGPAELAMERLLLDRTKRTLLEELSARERVVVKLHHGIGADAPYSFARIADFLAMAEGRLISKQMVSKIYHRGMNKIRRSLGA